MMYTMLLTSITIQDTVYILSLKRTLVPVLSGDTWSSLSRAVASMWDGIDRVESEGFAQTVTNNLKRRK